MIKRLHLGSSQNVNHNVLYRKTAEWMNTWIYTEIFFIFQILSLSKNFIWWLTCLSWGPFCLSRKLAMLSWPSASRWNMKVKRAFWKILLLKSISAKRQLLTIEESIYTFWVSHCFIAETWSTVNSCQNVSNFKASLSGMFSLSWEWRWNYIS